MKKSNLSIALYLLAVFASGILVGVFGQRLYVAKTVNANVQPRPDDFRRRYMDEMKKRLKLNETQVRDINAALDLSRDRIHVIRGRIQPEIDAVHNQQLDQIRSLLSDAQKSEYAKMLEERERARKK